MKKLAKFIYEILSPSIVIILLLSVLSIITNLKTDRADEDKKQLEETLKRALISCYSIEGAYPQSLDDIIEKYNIQYNENRYVIKYEFYASNLIPDITVLEKSHEKRN